VHSHNCASQPCQLEGQTGSTLVGQPRRARGSLHPPSPSRQGPCSRRVTRRRPHRTRVLPRASPGDGKKPRGRQGGAQRPVSGACLVHRLLPRTPRCRRRRSPPVAMGALQRPGAVRDLGLVQGIPLPAGKPHVPDSAAAQPQPFRAGPPGLRRGRSHRPVGPRRTAGDHARSPPAWGSAKTKERGDGSRRSMRSRYSFASSRDDTSIRRMARACSTASDQIIGPPSVTLNGGNPSRSLRPQCGAARRQVIPCPRNDMVGLTHRAMDHRGHSGAPFSTQRSNNATRSGGHAPSHGMDPFFTCSAIAAA
jgi:hypothetical protein